MEGVVGLREVDANKPDITLNLRSLLNDLIADGRLSVSVADQLSMKTRSRDQLNWHPLELIA